MSLDGLRRSLADRYRLDRELGGGMSRVFLAEELALGRPEVIKATPAGSGRRNCLLVHFREYPR